jgi:hypothetical protein
MVVVKARSNEAAFAGPSRILEGPHRLPRAHSLQRGAVDLHQVHLVGVQQCQALLSESRIAS